ncbi:sugar ABC transporter permease, partial [Mesorhizobium sp. M2D.F.Ca.ET.145.01.1.1]
MTRQKRSHHKLKRAVAPYLYLSPSLLIIGLLMLLPMVTVIGYSFQNSAVLRRDPSFAGLKHYQAIFDDPVFWASLWHTLYFTCMSVVFHMTIGMVFALMLNSDRINPTLRNILRVLYILPWLFTAVIIAVIWRLLLEPNGVVNSVLMQM